MTHFFRRYKNILLITLILLSCSCTNEDEVASISEIEQVMEPSIEEQSTESTVEEDFIEPEVDLLMVGDILLHDNVQNSGKLPDGTYNYDHLFENVVEDIQAADIAIANQEVILGGTELGLSGYPAFNGPFEAGDALVNAGFDVILHATNHTLDRGKKALLNCLDPIIMNKRKTKLFFNRFVISVKIL